MTQVLAQFSRGAKALCPMAHSSHADTYHRDEVIPGLFAEENFYVCASGQAYVHTAPHL